MEAVAEKKTLKQIRFDVGKTQLQIWEEVRVNPSRISLIENGRMIPDEDEKQKIASSLGVPVDSILWPELKDAAGAEG